MSCNCKNKPEIGRGVAFCNCEEECRASVCEGCFKLHETPWMAEYPDHLPTDIFEVRFKNTRRSYYQNVNNLQLAVGDIVAVEASPGHDIGVVSLTGDMVAKQMKRTGFNPYNGEFKKIYRKAKPYDIERWQEAIALEHETMIRSRQIAADMGLNMKIGDVEYQGDKIKAIFYYIADERVDFRELIKVFAEQFHIRIEMKQIGARQEAGRIGGLGACGRELCCASWISSFSSVTTNAARMQELSLNPQKLAGQCSKLKCCLMYEYDTYADARRDFPRVKEPLQALDGEYYLVKSDILARTMQFSSSRDALVNAVTLSVERVKEIQALNRAGQKVERLLDDSDTPRTAEEPSFRSEEDSITRFDGKRRNKRRRGGRKNDVSTSEGAASRAESSDAAGAKDGPQAGAERNGNRSQQRPERRPRTDSSENPVAERNGEAGGNTQQTSAPRNENRPRGDRRNGRRGNGGRGGEGRNGESRNGEGRNGEARNGEGRNGGGRGDRGRNRRQNGAEGQRKEPRNPSAEGGKDTQH